VSGDLVLGLGGSVDYEIVWSSSTMEALIAEYGIRASQLTTSVPVTSERSLVISLLAFMADGAGGERYIASSDIVRRFASRFEMRVALGGTCVRAAIAMSKLGIRSVLHLVSVNDYFRTLLPAECSYICSADQDSLDPHLIVQFGQGARVHSGDIDLEAESPNRVMYANDRPKQEMVLSDQLGPALRHAEIFLISGFNAVRDRTILDLRLVSLVSQMRGLPTDALVFYEDAAFHEPSLSGRVREMLRGFIDVYSLNEDEMQSYLGRRVDLLDVDDMEDALRSLSALIPVPTLVVHTKYWALAWGESAQDYADALRGGVTMASTRYCYGDAITREAYEEVGRFPANLRGQEFSHGVQERLGKGSVCCVPALALDPTAPTAVVGLGDSFVGGFIAAMTRRDLAV